MNNLSTKTKTMLLALSLFLLMSLIFSFLRYFELKQSQVDAKENKIQNIKFMLENEIIKTSSFYTNRALANLNSNDISMALNDKNIDNIKKYSMIRFNVLRRENIYLKSMIFYSNNSEVFLLGENFRLNLDKNNVNFSKFFLYKNKPYYAIFTKLESFKNYSNGIMFILDGNFLFEKIRHFKRISANFIMNNKNPTSELKNFKTYTLKLENLNRNESIDFDLTYDATGEMLKLKNIIYSNIFIILILLIGIFLILNYGFDIFLKKLEVANKKLQESENSLKSTNENLEKRVKEEIKKSVQNESILIEQNKLASMGEMIGNIAHQWRQPLSELGTIFIKLMILNDQKKLEAKTINLELKKCEKLIAFMSNTIDDFRQFFEKDKQKELYNINKQIKESINIINSALKFHNINLEILSKEEISIVGYKHEFSQVILNILSNAKDVLTQRNIKYPKITIEIFLVNSKIHITIKDNGGGVQVRPIEKIFEPYFTTKYASKGTGIGLYMSKVIIEKIGGNLIVRNQNNGAVFEVIL